MDRIAASHNNVAGRIVIAIIAIIAISAIHQQRPAS